ncbi:MAG: hypothetical protein Q8N98_02810 [bacterium]|nr:hypothetical protein [bacterium]
MKLRRTKEEKMPYICTDSKKDIDFFFAEVAETEEEMLNATKRFNLHIFGQTDPSNPSSEVICKDCHDYLTKKRKMANL